MGRGRGNRDRIERSDRIIVFYNASNWRTISIDGKSVPPMSLLELSPEEAADPRLKPYITRGMLQRIRVLEQGADTPQGQLLLDVMRGRQQRGTILLSRTYAFGDVLLVSAFVESFAASHPDDKIILHTSIATEPLVRHHAHAEIVAGEEGLHKAMGQTRAFIRLDDVAEFYEDRHEAIDLNRIEIFCDYVGIEPVTLCPSYYITTEEIESAREMLERYTQPFIAISPSSMRAEKSWHPHKWSEFITRVLEETGGTVFIFDSKDIVQYRSPRVVPLIGRQLRTCGAIGWHMNLFITQDSLWTHWAAALAVPQILLASCTDGNLLAKGYPMVRVIQRNHWDCCPCWYQFSEGGCNYGEHPKCLADVTAGEVVAAALEDLDGTKQRKRTHQQTGARGEVALSLGV